MILRLKCVLLMVGAEGCARTAAKSAFTRTGLLPASTRRRRTTELRVGTAAAMAVLAELAMREPSQAQFEATCVKLECSSAAECYGTVDSDNA